jgi:hypothetical protein
MGIRPAWDESTITFEAQDQLALKRFVGFMVSAGLLNALIAAYLLCRLPQSSRPTLASLFLRALLYVAIGALAGTIGARFYWRRSISSFPSGPPIPFASFAVICAAGWVWVPAAVLLSAQDSPATAAIAAVAAVLLAANLRRSIAEPPLQNALTQPDRKREIFAETLRTPARESYGYVIALCLYAAAFALRDGSNLTAGALIAISCFIFTWKLALAPGRRRDTRAAWRLAWVAALAVLVTFWALLFGVEHRNHSASSEAAFASGTGLSANDARVQNPKSQQFRSGVGGYESIILWPPPQKKQIIPPLPTQASLLAPGSTRPLVIRFDGPYWFLQPPDTRPGPTAHQARGTPIAVNIKSGNYVPLAMEAHQSLGAAIRLSRCREIQISVESRDNEPGDVVMAVLLSDSASPQNPRLLLGQQLVISNDPGNPAFRAAPSFKTLQFSIPAHASIRRFDEITVELIPDVEHSLVAPRIAIQQFQLLPR